MDELWPTGEKVHFVQSISSIESKWIFFFNTPKFQLNSIDVQKN